MKRSIGFKWGIAPFLGVIVTIAALGTARSTTSPLHIMLRNSGGVYVDACATSSYQEGQVYDMATGALIGTVPPGSSTIYNANNQVIGYLSPVTP
jgi:hypothetical protein